MPTDDAGIELALAEARAAAARGDVPIGAVVVAGDGRILGRGSNRRRETPDPTGHAEILALREACEKIGDFRLDRENATIFVTLEPCPMCVGALLAARVRRVVFGAAEPKFGACGSRVDLADPALGFTWRFDEVRGGVRAEDCAKILSNFFAAARAENLLKNA